MTVEWVTWNLQNFKLCFPAACEEKKSFVFICTKPFIRLFTLVQPS